MTRSQRAEQIILARYPYGLPHGALREIAAEVGCSHQNVHLVVRTMGLPSNLGALSEPLPQPPAPPPEQRICPECGAAFPFTDAQRKQAEKNMRHGRIADVEGWLPTCSQSCASRRGRRLGKERRTRAQHGLAAPRYLQYPPEPSRAATGDG